MEPSASSSLEFSTSKDGDVKMRRMTAIKLSFVLCGSLAQVINQLPTRQDTDTTGLVRASRRVGGWVLGSTQKGAASTRDKTILEL